MNGILTYLLPVFCCYISLWAGRSYLCFIDCPYIRKCPLIKLSIFSKHFTSNQNTTSLLAIQQWKGNPPNSNTTNSNFFLQNLICLSRRYAHASSYLTSCNSLINLQRIVYLVGYLRGSNTCRPASARRPINRLYSRLKAFNPPGNRWIRESTMPISGIISMNIALALISI